MAVPVGNVFGTTASAATFLQGDANGDGILNSVDAAYVNNYLLGRGSADGMMLARMDCDNDYAITKNDYNMIMRALSNQTTLSTVTRNALTVPLNESRMYIAYYPQGSSSGYTELPYTLDAVPAMTGNTREVTNLPDSTNVNVVLLELPGGAVGSGFIIDNHVIATAAHCVFDYDTGEFLEYVNVTICGEDGTQEIETFEALECHIPRSYRVYRENETLRRNYDYALIYVEEDLSDYGIWSLGMPTDEFLNSGVDVYASGYATISSISNAHNRYVSSGAIANYNSQYQLKTLADSYGGKSGGPIYCVSNGVKSAIGITSWGNTTVTYGPRITPPIMNFLLKNEMIGTGGAF